MKQFFLSVMVMFLTSSLYGSLHNKSAIFYYGDDFSYPMVGIHDYIVSDEKNVNVYSHGFDVYKDKIYIRIKIKKDGKNFQSKLDRLMKKGYKNFFIDAKALQNNKNLSISIKKFHTLHNEVKLLLEANNNLVKKVYPDLEALVVEGKLTTDSKNLLDYGLDIIDIEYTDTTDKEQVKNLIKQIQDKEFIPYVTTHLKTYGFSSKTAIKREVLTLIDESSTDRRTIGAHQLGALVLEYQGYIQKLYNVAKKGLPSADYVDHYAGVVVWLDEEYPSALEMVDLVKDLQKKNVKIVFVNNFGTEIDGYLLNSLGIEAEDSNGGSKKIVYRDKIIGYEIEPSLSNENNTFYYPDNSKSLLTIEDTEGLQSVPIAITPWGGYALQEACLIALNDENLWVVNPFEFFKKALNLKTLVVPDTTTENGDRLFFTHVDGDGIMNVVESNPELYSGDVLLEEILKKFKFPHSISVIGAEIDANGLYPKISKRLTQIARDMYALDNVEAATHTFTHPFKWGKIVNDDLPLKYRLKVKNYDFSIYREIKQSIDEINKDLVLRKDRPRAKTVFWSGDCTPYTNALELTYKYKILNINGGYTNINNASPWLSHVAPLGLERDGYYQIFTGAQNENVYTNEWLGPFWGFKKVVQTFKLTNSPRRLKPIDVYYHIYSASKTASLNALRYIFRWVMKQEVMPIYTSAYIPKAMDYFTVSMANDGDTWYLSGMRDLTTVRIEKKDASIVFKKSKTVVGLNHFENHTYIALDGVQNHFIKTTTKKSFLKQTYLTNANAKVVHFQNGIHNKRFTFKGEVPLKLAFHITKECNVISFPKESKRITKNKVLKLEYKTQKQAKITISCK
jgi:hypothetical protein